MHQFTVTNAQTGARLADRAELAGTFLARLRGLLGRPGLEDGEALILRPCNSVHMFFMRFPVDVAFLDRTGRVVGLSWNLPPGAVSPLFPGAVQAVELPAGMLGRTGTTMGDVLELRSCEKAADDGGRDGKHRAAP